MWQRIAFTTVFTALNAALALSFGSKLFIATMASGLVVGLALGLISIERRKPGPGDDGNLVAFTKKVLDIIIGAAISTPLAMVSLANGAPIVAALFAMNFAISMLIFVILKAPGERTTAVEQFVVGSTGLGVTVGIVAIYPFLTHFGF